MINPELTGLPLRRERWLRRWRRGGCKGRIPWWVTWAYGDDHMSRTDQYIGLTRAAESYVSGRNKLKTTPLEGVFGNSFELGVWAGDDGATLVEVLQASPWSSGPMYFTRLKLLFDNSGYVYIFDWVLDPTVETEVDYERGHYWV